MKAAVVRSFKDKHKNTIHKPGTVITVSKERFEEINSTALGVFLVEEKEEDKAGD